MREVPLEHDATSPELVILESPTTAGRGLGKHTGTFQLNVQLLDHNNLLLIMQQRDQSRIEKS